MNLGDKVKCKITGYTGILTAVTSYLNGQTNFTLQAPIGADGKFVDAIYANPEQSELIEKGVTGITPKDYSKSIV